jgi:hypothetical protein
MISRIAVSVVAVGLAACGGSVPNSSLGGQLAAYQATGQALANSVQAYAVQSSSVTSQTACEQAQAQYDHVAGPLVDRMHEMSRTMDQDMDHEGSHDLADMECVAQAMEAEMARHRAEACQAADVSGDHAEATQHATTMVGWVEHQRIRYQDLAAMGGMMAAHAESTFSCQANPDGTFTFTSGGTQTHYPDPAPGRLAHDLPEPEPVAGSVS